MDIAYFQVGTPDNQLRTMCEHVIDGVDQYQCTAAPTKLDIWWVTGSACGGRKLAYEPTDTGRGWFQLHLHHLHVSLSSHVDPGAPARTTDQSLAPGHEGLPKGTDPRARLYLAPVHAAR